MAQSQLQYIDAASAVELLTGPHKDRTLVIDVRGQDFLGGHIRGAVNISSDKWEDDDDVENTIREHLPGKDTVIVHCALSQVRGPFCADRLTSRLAALEQPDPPQVLVLAQGFNGFVRRYGDRQDLCADVDTSVHR